MKKNDVVTLDGKQRVVDNVRDDFSCLAAPRVVLVFTDGGSYRVHAGAALAVERPA
ncbi:hypothetical protein [Streptomyces sp. H39-C1]|uniref:hypothetical protein n=1 Tax=Streptomyces sp. H39-C1 TaxID=3004355 RepID=UPI0022AED004|nr:hypothetical protein [Streptomyces sp. H39-C1]MCZ4101090.1 hypothetical protein [Streptomyces sp. H39-C1]